MIPTRRRNPWRASFWAVWAVLLVALVLGLGFDVKAAQWAALFATAALWALLYLVRSFETREDGRILTVVYGHDQEATWSRGFDAGVVTERRRQQR